MDKGTPDLAAPAAALAEGSQAAVIEHDIEVIFDHLDGLVRELGGRRHRLNPLMAARRHPAAFVLAGASVLGAMTSSLLFRRARRRQQRTWLGRAQRARAALACLIHGALRPAPRLGVRVLTTIATAAAAVAARHLARRLASQFSARR